MFGLGELPKAYNPKVHGPYDPAIFYGKKDSPFGQVKLAELPAWLARREKTPAGIARAFSRAFWRWNHNYMLPKRTGLAPIFQFAFLSCAFFYAINYTKYANHRNYKYHW